MQRLIRKAVAIQKMGPHEEDLGWLKKPQGTLPDMHSGSPYATTPNRMTPRSLAEANELAAQAFTYRDSNGLDSLRKYIQEWLRMPDERSAHLSLIDALLDHINGEPFTNGRVEFKRTGRDYDYMLIAGGALRSGDVETLYEMLEDVTDRWTDDNAKQGMSSLLDSIIEALEGDDDW